MSSEAMGYSLDDYIYSLEARGGARGGGGGADPDADIHAQLLAKADVALSADMHLQRENF